MINGHSAHIVKYISPAEMLRFLIISNQWLSGMTSCRSGRLAGQLHVSKYLNVLMFYQPVNMSSEGQW